MGDDAIQTDVSTGTDEQEHKPTGGIKSRREEMMEYLEGQRNREFLEESQLNPDDLKAPDVAAPGAQATPEVTEVEKQVASQTAEPAKVETPSKEKAPSVLEATPDAMVTVKINGEEKLVSLAELTKGYQKDVAGDRKLEQAAQKERELEIREAVLKDRETRTAPAPATEPGADKTVSPEDEQKALNEKAKNLAMDLADGEIEKAIPVIVELLAGGKRDVSGGDTGSQVDPNQLVDAVTAQVTAQLENQRAYNDFNTQFKEIADEPDRMKIANMFYHEEINKAFDEGRAITYREAIMSAGQRTKDLLGLKDPDPPPPEDKKDDKKEFADRKEKKKTINTLPSAGGTHAAESKEPVELTPSQVIANMREARQKGRV